ncbi:MAG: 50S ribosomal protein L5 [Candidatus Omnitrophica bacterium]|nr:50S ribosomal protein L5 [Candidatus Omnitrophota bacterium]MBU1995952.1 50S ribosomal protein L5 [Candidatus Omnitrophota bacterium]MBU4333518.1 50S ribosomal protein L5 [Candidatus Omnitrophota bacterium]
MSASLKKKYEEEIVPKIKEKFGVRNSMAVPKFEKIVVNMGVGKAITDMKALESAVKDLGTITGRKPIIIRSKKAISNFKLREDIPIACKVTLRRDAMYEFFERLVNVCLPRIRDFNGVSRNSFDKQGNYTFGISDQSIFPEIDPGRIQYTQGMDISIVFNKGPQEQTFEVLSLMGMPFSKK